MYITKLGAISVDIYRVIIKHYRLQKAVCGSGVTPAV